MLASLPDRGQSSPIGVVLLLGLTLTAAVGIVAIGGDAIRDTQSRSEIGQAEQAMSQFDARAAQVALGDSEAQTVSLGGQSGQYRVENDVGRVRLIHENWNGTDCDDCEDYASFDNTTDDGNTTILYNETLGAVVYESDDTEVAYQGGGVWRRSPEGDSRLVSSPEFHYRGATLTFPLVRIEGSDGASGQVTARVNRVETAEDVYANTSETYPDGSTELLNPVQNGNVSVEITSDYCEGWRTYFEERTEGDVSDCNGGTVTAEIITLGTQGDFSIIGGESISVRGQDAGHSLDSLDLQFRGDSASDFNNFGWSMAGETGDKRIEIYVEKRGGGTNCGDPVRTVVYYSDNDGDNYHTWVLDENHGTNPFEITCPAGDEILDVDLLDSSRTFEYTDAANHGSDDLLTFDNYDQGTFNSTEDLSGHPADPGTTESTGDEEPVDLVVQHHFTMMDDMDVSIEERQQGNAGLNDQSVGNIVYDGGGNVVTYLHVTENRVRVELS
ncbi:DUF7289 family protein [Natronomonas marina]|jgi:flagellin-like protein|uniref:DUF7289 family protein n=1 Tax=Natronomonas marina TaxID=2961939 RepID=UPI0020C98BB6|nr:archaellin/type IV pilin N-terminal domain-containing protein [Natronomonas marina]